LVLQNFSWYSYFNSKAEEILTFLQNQNLKKNLYFSNLLKISGNARNIDIKNIEFLKNQQNGVIPKEKSGNCGKLCGIR
jgi:hypothetical protein